MAKSTQAASAATAKTAAGDDEGMIFGIVSYLVWLIGPLITILARYHAKQALVLDIAVFIIFIPVVIITVLIGGVSMFLGPVAVLGMLINFLIWTAYSLVCLILVVIGIVNVVKKNERPLPIIGKYAAKFNF